MVAEVVAAAADVVVVDVAEEVAEAVEAAEDA